MKIPFSVYVSTWLRVESQAKRKPMTIQKEQVELCEWFERTLNEPITLCMATRDFGKSYNIMLGAAYILENDPDTSIVMISQNKKVVQRNMDFLKVVIEHHPLNLNLKNRLRGKKVVWNRETLRIPGSMGIHPSVDLRSVDSGITGAHGDILICDDLETRENVRSEARREKLHDEILAELDNVGEKKIIYVGTPWAYDSIYRGVEDALVSYEKNHCIKKIPWKPGLRPDFFTPIKLAEIKRKGEFNWRTQYLLEYLDRSIGGWDIKFLNTYTEEIKRVPTSNFLNMTLMGKEIINYAAYYDSAKAYKGNQDNATLALMLNDADGNYFTHAMKTLPAWNETIGYDAQFNKICATMRKYQLENVHVEEFGHSDFHTQLRRYAANHNIPLNPIKSYKKPLGGGKERFIGDVIEPILFNGNLWIKEDQISTQLEKEFREFPEAKHDDHLDAMASAIDKLNPAFIKEELPRSYNLERFAKQKASQKLAVF